MTNKNREQITGLGERIEVYLKTHKLKQKALSDLLGLSPSYMNGLVTGRSKGTGGKFWNAIRDRIPECEDYFRGKTAVVPAAPLEKAVADERQAGQPSAGYTITGSLEKAASVLESGTHYAAFLHAGIAAVANAAEKDMRIQTRLSKIEQTIADMKPKPSPEK